MIFFSLTLTANQIQCLRAVADSTDDPESMALARISNFVVGVRLLIREGLVEHQSRPTRMLITEKGRMVLKLVEMDVADFQASIAERTPPKPENGKVRRARSVSIN